MNSDWYGKNRALLNGERKLQGLDATENPKVNFHYQGISNFRPQPDPVRMNRLWWKGNSFAWLLGQEYA